MFCLPLKTATFPLSKVRHPPVSTATLLLGKVRPLPLSTVNILQFLPDMLTRSVLDDGTEFLICAGENIFPGDPVLFAELAEKIESTQ